MIHTDLPPKAMDEVLAVLLNERFTHWGSRVVRVKGIPKAAMRFMLNQGYLAKGKDRRYHPGPFGVSYDGRIFNQEWFWLPIEMIWHVVAPMLDDTGHAGRSIIHRKEWGKLNIYSGERGAEDIWKVLAELAAYGYIWFQSAGDIWAIQKREREKAQ